MPARTDTLVSGAGSVGLFCALRWAERGSVTVVEAGPDAGDPPPRWALYDYVLPDGQYYRYTDSDTGKPVPQGRGLGTCRMGDPAAAGTVVGPDLAVLGTSGLAVADSSVMPVIPRANTNLASMMIGYRSADVITS